MHRISGRWRLGLALASIAALMWAMLPIALKPLLGALDAYTITWVRFAVASLLLGTWATISGSWPRLGRLGSRVRWLLVLAVLGLTANYVLYLAGLDYITPGAAQLVIQLAPMLMLLGGLAVFGERFNRWQWLGFAILFAGLLLFFNHRVSELFGGASSYGLGVLLIVIASFTWAAYALVQKELLVSMGAPQVMLVIYIAGSVILLPTTSPAAIVGLNGIGFALLAFAALNTVVAYGAFAEALNHWEASRVSAVLATTPLLTLAAMAVIGQFTDAVVAEPVNTLSAIGAAMTVCGSMITALSGSNSANAAPTVAPE